MRKFSQQFGANYPILLDTTGNASSQYRIQGLPVTWFIDPQGIARAQVIGELTNELISSELKQTGFEVAAPNPLGQAFSLTGQPGGAR